MKLYASQNLLSLRTVFLIAGSVFVMGLGACQFKAPNGDMSGAKPGAKPGASAVKSPYAAIANGKVDVEGGVIQVAARRQGIVREVLVQEGDIVTKGQVLAKQEDDQARLSVATAQASVAQAEIALGLTRVNLAAAEREYARFQALSPDNYVAKQKIDQLHDTIDQSKATIASQEAAIKTARAQLASAQYDLELTNIRAPVDGKIIRRYANPGSGASTLNVTAMFDLEPKTDRIVRAEIVESSIPDVHVAQAVEIVPEVDETKVFVGSVKRIAATFGARKLISDAANEASDERVVEVVVTADSAPFLIGQRVLVKFMKPGEVAGAVHQSAKPAKPAN